MIQVLLRRQTRYRANHEIVRLKSESRTASIAIIACRIEALKVDSIGNHDHLLAPTSEQFALRKQQPPDGPRLTDNSLTPRFISDSGNQSKAVYPLDDRPYTSLLSRPDAFSPCINNADIDAILAELCDQFLVISFTAALISFRPGRVRGALGVSEQNRDTQTLDLA